MIEISEVKFNPRKPGSIGITFVRHNSTAGPEHIQFSGHEEPHPDLVKALAALGEWVPKLAELDSVQPSEITVVGVTIKTTQRGAVVKAYRTLKNNTRPLNLATPLVLERDSEEKKGAAPQAFLEAVDRVAAEAVEAVEYIEGRKRAQAELALEQEDDQGDLELDGQE